MKYIYTCHDDGQFEVDASIRDGPPSFPSCPSCGSTDTRRVYSTAPVHFHCQGFHATDYDSRGDKLERLNRNWSAKTGEKPPPPAKDIKRNSSGPQ